MLLKTLDFIYCHKEKWNSNNKHVQFNVTSFFIEFLDFGESTIFFNLKKNKI